MQLMQWKDNPRHKPLLLRGARQVGKSSTICNLGRKFDHFIEVNFEYRPELKEIFRNNHDVRIIAADLGKIFNTPVIPGKTLLFFDEIQACEEALKSLWFFKENYPQLHVIAAGSLLEFALKKITSYGVGRIRSLFMYPLSFDEFLNAMGKEAWTRAIKEANPGHPVSDVLHAELVRALRIFMIIGGMPASVRAWVETMDYSESANELKDIQQSYYDDFTKYDSKIDPRLLRNTLNAVVNQTGKKFIFSHVAGGYRPEDVRQALTMLTDAGLIKPVRHTAANGLPIGAETNDKFVKYQLLDTGLLLQILDLNFGGVSEVTTEILTASATDLVNKGGLAEMLVGWELVKGASARTQQDLYYWESLARGSEAEVDFVITREMKIMPIEVKSGVAGKMKSLRLFISKKGLSEGVRTTLENFGTITYKSEGAPDVKVFIIPIYAIGKIYEMKLQQT